MGKMSQEVKIVLGVVALAVGLGLASFGLLLDSKLKTGDKEVHDIVPLVSTELVPLMLGACIVALLVMKR